MIRAPFIVRSTLLSSLLLLPLACSSSSTPEADDDGGKTATGDSGSTLYTRLGEAAGIRSAVNAIVGQELMNEDIASYFFNQTTPPKAGHPSADQIEECFTILVASAAGGPQTYPATVTDEGGSFTCQSMSAAHAGLMINTGTFDEFVMIAGAELTTLEVASADVTTLAGVLNGTESDIVTAGDGGLQKFPGAGG
jgi:hypothetical protein